MRLGITDIKLNSKFDGIERKVIDVMVHPNYKSLGVNPLKQIQIAKEAFCLIVFLCIPAFTNRA